MQEVQEQIQSYTVSSIIQFVTNSIHTDLDNQLFVLEGIFIKKNGKVYDNYYYDYVGDINTGIKISAKIPANIRDKLVENNAYKFEGFVMLVPYKDIYNILFTVTKLVEKKNDYVDENIKKYYEILKKKSVKKNIDRIILDKLSKGEMVNIAFLFGENAITDTDVYNHLGEYKKYYNIEEYKVLLKPNNIINTLSEIKDKNHDFIAIIRGGGDLDTFNNLVLVDYCATYTLPIVTAIGHTEDNTYLDAVADKIFNTPTIFGVYLKNMVEEFVCNREELRKKNEEYIRKEVIKDIEKNYNKLIEEKNKNFENLLKEKTDYIKKIEQNTEKLMIEKNTYLIEKEKLSTEREKFLKNIEKEYKDKINLLIKYNSIMKIVIIVMILVIITFIIINIK